MPDDGKDQLPTRRETQLDVAVCLGIP